MFLFLIKNFSVYYSKEIISPKNLNLVIKKSSMVFLRGPSTSGKSTLLKVLSGVFDYDKYKVTGNIFFNGDDILNSTYDKKKLLNSVFYLPSSPEDVFYKNKLLDEFLSFGINENVIINFFYDFGLNLSLLDKNPSQLSGGQKRICAIIIALAKKPNILLMDNALAGLDDFFSDICIKNLKKLCTTNKSTIVLT